MPTFDLAGQRVLVTGATGFLGGRLVERLVLETGARVRVIVRDFNKTSRIARFPIEMMRGDLANEQDVQNVMKDIDLVFHCAWAYSNPQNAAQIRRMNLQGTRNVMAAALRAKAERVVHVSTVSVYHYQKSGDITERSPSGAHGEVYGDSKWEAENIVRSFIAQGLPAVILQPSVIYGPWSTIWTVSPLTRLKNGFLALDDGMGFCNAVYVDDVVQAMLLAAQEQKTVGGTFLISGEQPVRWKDFYGAYEKMLGVKSLLFKDSRELWDHVRWQSFLNSPLGQRLQPLRNSLTQNAAAVKLYLACKKKTEVLKKDLAANRDWRPVKMPNEVILKLWQSQAVIRIDKARDELGYRPRFDLTRGMAVTEQWARWANLLSEA